MPLLPTITHCNSSFRGGCLTDCSPLFHTPGRTRLTPLRLVPRLVFRGTPLLVSATGVRRISTYGTRRVRRCRTRFPCGRRIGLRKRCYVNGRCRTFSRFGPLRPWTCLIRFSDSPYPLNSTQ